jgi:signal transduction histidine kinase
MRSEELLCTAAVRLARSNAALEDFAALVAHELKAPLLSARFADNPSSSIEQALQLVDSLLQSALDETTMEPHCAPTACLEQVVRELGRVDVELTAELSPTFPFPAQPLVVLLRNMLRNALASGATAIQVSTERSEQGWTLVVEDDGVGLADTDGYASGSGLGLELSRSLAGRFGGTLELAPRTPRGARATLILAESA